MYNLCKKILFFYKFTSCILPFLAKQGFKGVAGCSLGVKGVALGLKNVGACSFSLIKNWGFRGVVA